MSKYKVTKSAVTQLLEDVKRENIAIPELQRPFVWDSVKVRDLMDSLCKGYPVCGGFLISSGIDILIPRRSPSQGQSSAWGRAKVVPQSSRSIATAVLERDALDRLGTHALDGRTN